MEINQSELMSLLGAKEVELYLLRKRVAELEAALAALPKPESPQ